MRILFLDDDWTRHETFRTRCPIHYELVAVETASEAIEALSSAAFDLVFLDHDLGGQTMVESGEGTGYEVALYMAENAIQPALTVVHSYNPEGAGAMVAILSAFGIRTQRALFGSDAFFNALSENLRC